MPNLTLFDFHTHPTLKPYHSKDPEGNFPNPNHWDEPDFESMSEQVYNRVVDSLYPQIIIRSQSYLEACKDGNLLCLCVALYPLEHGFIRTRNYIKVLQGPLGFLVNLFNKDHVKIKLKFRKILSAVIGISPQKVKPLFERGYNYYPDLLGETENLLQQIPRLHNGVSVRTVVPNNFEELNALDFQTQIAVILSVEGVHSFISTTHISKLKNKRNLWKPRFKKYYDSLGDQAVINIYSYKRKHEGLFYVTFGHHFYNLFCGHCKSLPGILFNQMPQFYNAGISPKGFELITALLSRKDPQGNKVSRVLIDTKHMSVQSRIDYHRYVRSQRGLGNSIPIIQTHTAMAGRTSMYALESRMKQGMNIQNSIGGEELSTISNTLQTIALNLFDDELIEIIESDGMIGIMLDEKRTMGKKLPEFTPHSQYTLSNGTATVIDSANKYKQAKKQLGKLLFREKYDLEHKEDSQDPDIQQRRDQLRKTTDNDIAAIRNALKPMLCAMVLNQIIYIAEVYVDSLEADASNSDKQRAWNHICLGSDFDGVINPLDAYPDSSFLTEFATDLERFWRTWMPHRTRLEDSLYGLQPGEIVEKLLWTNAMDFMRKYFSRAYRLGEVA